MKWKQKPHKILLAQYDFTQNLISPQNSWLHVSQKKKSAFVIQLISPNPPTQSGVWVKCKSSATQILLSFIGWIYLELHISEAKKKDFALESPRAFHPKVCACLPLIFPSKNFRSTNFFSLQHFSRNLFFECRKNLQTQSGLKRIFLFLCVIFRSFLGYL